MAITAKDIIAARITRDDLEYLEKHVSVPTVFVELVVGAFARVLMESEGERKKYQVARIKGTTTNANGKYHFGNLTTTDKLLQLDFGSSEATYQINTVSNNIMTDQEVQTWLLASEDPPTVATLRAKAHKIKEFRESHEKHREPRNEGTVHKRGTSNAKDSEFTPPRGGQETTRRRSLGSTSDGRTSPHPPQGPDNRKRFEESLKLHQQLDHLKKVLGDKEQLLDEKDRKISELNEQLKSQFPSKDSLAKLSVEELRKIENSADEYRQHVRTLINEKSKCIICMEENADIIFYPCQHRIACVACSEKVQQCPMCRQPIGTRIKPFGN